ncbi:sigma-54-dependent Fis family transcriptional regulator [Labrys monachus]|uniref:Transcriptional regulator of acetoin/glycerol metabolism n=1 Tax=Labrys monachus TaxID=217067 RepID=A0ABU0FCQ2_9HYPH|nr:sigma-54-dependent Fis family transcriptional regulator [Labrys monachus]MDQ0391919.1 transcriptional regulator of acetoin/glycerol metabolism [Labrys monachus]
MQPLSNIERARSALEEGRRIPSGALSSLVASSWERCRDLGLDPGIEPRDVVVPFPLVQRLREEHSGLRRLALAEMQLLHAQIAGSNFLIAFADPDGVVLDTISDQHFADSRSGRSIIPGSAWGEAERGTNALGLAVRQREPVAIYGREHYFRSHGHLSCMAAPILDAGGQLVGLLDASCSHEARQQHTHALVRMAAAQIENGLIYQERSNLFIFAFHPRAEYLDTLSAGLIAVSRDGAVSSLNRPGQAMLAGLPAAAGCHFEDLFEGRFGAAMDGLLDGGVVRIRDRAGSAVFMVCRQIGARAPAADLPGRGRLPPGPAPAAAPPAAPGFVCLDPALRRTMEGLADATRMRMPVHICGETGTGKELMARHVHAVSGRRGEFVALNCGALPETLFVSEIFGHERGAFTNARQDGAPGLARLADGGTLFLDEVADIPAPAQTVLLRFLDSMEIRAVGGQKTRKVDVQIVSATNADLAALVRERRFRADLLFRLNAFTLALPPLRERQDFAAVVRHLMQAIAPEAAITDAAIERLRRGPWPGNIRELQATLQRAYLRGRMTFVDEDALDPGDAEDQEACDACAGHPLNRIRCREIRAAYTTAGSNIAVTARTLGLSRTTVYKHVR